MRTIFAFFALLLASTIVSPAMTNAGGGVHYVTEVKVVNGTDRYISVDSYTHWDHTKRYGLVAPDKSVDILYKRVKPFATDVFVYVKSKDASETICAVMTTVGNSDHIHTERVHFDGKRCWIVRA
ncbi:MAG: hypothetical protein KGN02_02550 [bacterium]|nr:hypothetical protein [bacterium]